MSEFVDYAKDLIETAKGFAERSKTETEPHLEQAFLRASLLHGFSFLEAHLNEIADHFRGKKILSVHELGILLEKEVRLDKGTFKLSQTVKYSRNTDKIELLLKHFSDDVTSAKGSWFSELSQAVKLRNKLVHPKEREDLTHSEVTRALKAIIDCIDALFRAVFKKGFPYKSKPLEGGFAL